MPWSIEWSIEAAKDLSKLEQADAKRIVKKIETTLSAPKRFWKRLSGFSEYKLRIGKYRVVAEFSEKKQNIFIEKVGHRKNIYKKLKH